nr:PEP-CTERM sorting domain-containing protein [uncultured Albidiferax sp.]
MAFLNSIGTWLGGVVLGAALLSSPAQVSAVILSGMGPNTTPYTYVDPIDPANNVTTPLVGLQSDAAVGPVVESINILGPAYITSITWWGYYLELGAFKPGTDPDNFLFSGGASVTVSPVTPWDDGIGGTIQLYKYFVSLTDLDPNGIYFPGGAAELEIVNSLDDAAWYWQGSAADPFGPRAYLIEGNLVRQEIPEPSSIALFGLALLALGASRARKLR